MRTRILLVRRAAASLILGVAQLLVVAGCSAVYLHSDNQNDNAGDSILNVCVNAPHYDAVVSTTGLTQETGGTDAGVVFHPNGPVRFTCLATLEDSSGDELNRAELQVTVAGDYQFLVSAQPDNLLIINDEEFPAPTAAANQPGRASAHKSLRAGRK